MQLDHHWRTVFATKQTNKQASKHSSILFSPFDQAIIRWYFEEIMSVVLLNL